MCGFADGGFLFRKGEAMTGYYHYYVNDNAQLGSGDHEVHRERCSWLAFATSKTYLGYYSNCKDAMAKAMTIYRQSDGCAYCCKECHKS